MYSVDVKAHRFCNCDFEQEKWHCKCGEVAHTPAWGWSQTDKTASAYVFENNQLVCFHYGYSRGTACVKGDTPFVRGNYYYWELKIIRPVYGTSVMIGVGTSKVNIAKYSNQFCHLLGDDDESWGLTFDGWLRHQNVPLRYHQRAGFQQGSIIGVHLDMWQGTLEFFLNRQPLGIAFQGLRDKVLYPMISSTAAKSSMRLIYSNIQPHSLLYISLKKLANTNKDTLPYGLHKYLPDCWWNFPKPVKKEIKGRNSVNSLASQAIYVLIDSDEEDDENEGNRVLALRMKRVLENSSGAGSDLPGDAKRLTLRPLSKRL